MKFKCNKHSLRWFKLCKSQLSLYKSLASVYCQPVSNSCHWHHFTVNLSQQQSLESVYNQPIKSIRLQSTCHHSSQQRQSRVNTLPKPSQESVHLSPPAFTRTSQQLGNHHGSYQHHSTVNSQASLTIISPQSAYENGS